MKSAFGKIATTIVCIGSMHAVMATPGGSIQNSISAELVSIGNTEPQDALGFTVGQICPGGLAPGVPGGGEGDNGVLLDVDLSDRCTEIVVSGVFSMDSSGDSDVQAGLQGMAPEEDAAVASSQLDVGNEQTNNVGSRQASLGGRGAGAGVTYNKTSGFNWSTGAAGDVASPWGFFVNGLYVNADRDSSSREAGFESDGWGVTGGVDYSFSEKFVFGLAFGYTNTDADIDRNGGSLETDSTSFMAYWSIYPDENWYIDAMAGYTDNDHDQDRNISYSIATVGAPAGTITTVSNTAVSDTDSDEFSVSVTAGHNFYSGSWILSPYGRIEYADIDIDGFTERMQLTSAAGSGLALQIDDQDFESLMFTFGGSATAQWGERYFPQVSVEYIHEFKNNNTPITGRFVNDASRTTFTLLTDPPDRNFVNIGAGMTAVLSDGMTGFARYQGLVGYKDLDVHTVEVGLRFAF